MKKINIKDVFLLVISILICQGAGFIGSLFTRPSIPTWYATLEKPSFTPPNGVFSPVWIMLFALMGIALFLVWRTGLTERKARIALGFFGMQLIFNILWSASFFGLRSPFVGLIDIAVLWIAIALTIFFFFKISKVAASLLLPYIVWVSFAVILNFSIWTLNT
ncbi:MAG: tryptophan-rich sensory protein [Deltaproteobacteria bacterium]|nr:tryptophan-rich sensory protein [Deltaproteobacteria bacterium]